jgi:hypothetical protein
MKKIVTNRDIINFTHLSRARNHRRQLVRSSLVQNMSSYKLPGTRLMLPCTFQTQDEMSFL